MKSGDSNAGISLQKVVGLTAAPFIAIHLPILSSQFFAFSSRYSDDAPREHLPIGAVLDQQLAQNVYHLFH